MDQLKFTTVAHHDHVFCSPLSYPKVDRILTLLELSSHDRVIDVGCGKAELLIRLVERFGVHAVGIDTNPHFVREAAQRAATRISAANLALYNTSIANFNAEAGSYSTAFCIGSAHAYGGYRATLRRLAELVRGGGQLLVGEGYWKRTPDPAYLAVLGAGPDDYRDHAGNVAAGVEEGLTPLYACASSEEEWDHYEGLYGRAVERYVLTHPDDADGQEMRQRNRRWREAYLRWGRDTLGFGLYLFQK